MSIPRDVKLVEVGPRDGLQNEKTLLSTEIKVDFINQLSQTGLSAIEVTSFVSAKWIPQLADHAAVFQQIQQHEGISYPVLVPNLQGLEKAIAVGVKEIAVFTTPSQQFSLKNTNKSVEDSLQTIADIMQLAKQHQIMVRGYLSCVLGCPYGGIIQPKKVVELAKKLLQLGCYEISLGDTIGVGTPTAVKQLIELLAKEIPLRKLAVHFHDTYGQALANIYAALESGIRVIDSSVAGLGGCPYAKGASGNVATEDVVYMLNGMGIHTGVDLIKLVKVGHFISSQLNKPSQSKVGLALASNQFNG
jgi:hydroxymethylglutaryl-CoA lyase